MALKVIILAAGEGKRMQSGLPKILHPLAGKPLLQHVYEKALALDPAEIFILFGHAGEQVRSACADFKVTWVEQTEQRGTGHAVQQVLPYLKTDDHVLILSGDVPLVGVSTLKQLTQDNSAQQVNLLIADCPTPAGLGRILRDQDGEVTAIVEEKDATEQQKQIQQIYSGIMALPASALEKWLPQLGNDNAQGEMYLTDIVSLAIAEKMPVQAYLATRYHEVLGINNRVQLAELERLYQQDKAQELMLGGVTIIDPARFDCRAELTIGRDVTIDINVIFEGKVTIGDNVTIGPHCLLRNVTLGSNIHIKAHTVIEEATLADHCECGPFARIRPGTDLAEHTKVGNFVEIKKSRVGPHSKINHLSYIGDSEIGERVNIGAGTITCNYDGINKHQTVIEDDVMIGSDTQLVAPVRIGSGAYIGAGSTITRDAPAGQLTFTKREQRSIPDWQSPKQRGEQQGES